jgi:hypothetical protein
MIPTYIFVDFENVQPPDLDLLRGEECQVLVFRGPHQKKLDAEMVSVLQPLGDRVKYIKSTKPGKNALDFHIAFTVGRLIESRQKSGIRARFIIISRDNGFDSLLSHVRSLGYETAQGASIRDALGVEATESATDPPTEKPAARAPAQSNANGAPAPATPSQSVKVLAKASCVANSVTSPDEIPIALQGSASGTKESPTAKAKPTHGAPAKKPAVKSSRPLRSALGSDDRAKLINQLRASGNKRPASRKALERHIVSYLGNDLTSQAAQNLIKQLEAEGIFKFEKTAVGYKLPKPGKA